MRGAAGRRARESLLNWTITGYLEHNIFLPDINNEQAGGRTSVYAERLASLDAFVMVRFAEDVMVKPGETAVRWHERTQAV